MTTKIEESKSAFTEKYMAGNELGNKYYSICRFGKLFVTKDENKANYKRNVIKLAS